MNREKQISRKEEDKERWTISQIADQLDISTRTNLPCVTWKQNLPFSRSKIKANRQRHHRQSQGMPSYP